MENSLTNWLIAVGTLSLALIAVFQDKIRAYINKPKLEIFLENKPPDCHKTFLTTGLRSSADSISQPLSGSNSLAPDRTYADCYYFRIRIKNVGNRRAEMVEVFASELAKKMAEGTFKKVDAFLPMNLVWSHIGGPFFGIISPGMEKHCDLAHIIDPRKNVYFDFEEDPRFDLNGKTFLSLNLIVKPFTMGHLLQPGIYRLKLLIAASNTEPMESIIEINHTGNWFDDEKKMLDEGIGLKLMERD